MADNDFGFQPDGPASNTAVADLGFTPDNAHADLGFVPQSTEPPHDALYNLEEAIPSAIKEAGHKFESIKDVLTGDIKPQDASDQALINRHPIAKFLGDLAGGVGTTVPLAAIPGVGLPTAFGAASALQKAGSQADDIQSPQFQTNAAQLFAQQAIAGGAGAITGQIFDTPATGKILPSILGGVPSTVASRAAEQALGAGATGLTEDIASRAVGGQPQDVPSSLVNAGLNTAIYGLTTAAVKMPELQDAIMDEATRMNNGKAPEDMAEAKDIVKQAGINPENLSPDFVTQAYNARRQSFEDNQLKPLMEKYGADEETAAGVLQDKDAALRQQTAFQWLYKLNKINPEQASQIQPYIDQIAKGADPVDVMMAADLQDKILAPLMNKVTQSITPEQEAKLSEFTSPENVATLKGLDNEIAKLKGSITPGETADVVKSFQAEAQNPINDQAGIPGQPLNLTQSNPTPSTQVNGQVPAGGSAPVSAPGPIDNVAATAPSIDGLRTELKTQLVNHGPLDQDKVNQLLTLTRQQAASIPDTSQINTPEREALRDNIANQLYGQGASQKDRKAILVTGLPAAGKNSNAVIPLAKKYGAVIIDNDLAKEGLPEYQQGLGAAATHAESGYIEDQIRDRSMSHGDNMVIVRLGKNYKTMKAMIKDLKDKGYSVGLVNVSLPMEKAQHRAVTRYIERGRFVDPEFIKKEYLQIKNTNDMLQSEALFNEGKQTISTDVPHGAPAVHLSGHEILQLRPGRASNATDANTSRPQQGRSGTQDTGNAAPGQLSPESGQASLPGVDTGAKILKEIINVVSPTTFVPRASMDTIMSMKGARDRGEFGLEVDRTLSDIEKAFNKMPQEDAVSFINNIKRGLKQPTEQLQAVADMMRKIEDAFWAAARQYKPSLAYKENHYRVLWKVVPGSDEARKAGFKGLFRRPLQGSKGFMKRSTLADMSEGLENGGVPYSFNPISMWRTSIMDMQKYITAQRMWAAMKEMGYVKFVRFGGRVPDGFVKMNDSIAKVYFPTDPGMVNAGDWVVEENTGRILNNFLGPDWIRQSAIGGSLLKFKNITTAMELSLSPFHASYVSIVAMTSSTGLGLQKIANRGLHGDAGAFLDGLKNIAEGLIPTSSRGIPLAAQKMFRAGTAAYKYVAEGQQAPNPNVKYISGGSFDHSRLAQDFLTMFPDGKALLDDLFTGGGKLAMHQDYKINSLKAFQEGIKNKEPWAVTMSALPAANEMIMKPLFEIYIPRMKVGAFLHEMSNELIQRQTQLQNGELTRPQLARQVWQSIENRFGEMNFDNLFWDRTFKSAMQLVFRSVTWKLGALKNISSGFADQAMEIKNSIDHNRAPLLNRNTAWLLGIALMISAFSAIIMKLFLGKLPEDLRDIVAPRYDKQGNRISLNTHIKDWIHLAHSPLGFVTNSLSGQIGKFVELWNNKDFYGTEIHHPGDPWWKQAKDIALHQVPIPFIASNQGKLKNDQAPAALKGMVAAGIAQPSPAYVSQSPALEKAYTIAQGKYSSAPRTQAQFDHSQFKHQLLLDIQSGQMTPLHDALSQGKITEREFKNIVAEKNLTPLQRVVHQNSFTYDDVAAVIQKSDPSEIKQIMPYFVKKIDNKMLNSYGEQYQSLKAMKKEIISKYGGTSLSSGV